MCQPRGSHRALGASGCTCGCCGGGTFRRFISSQEEQEMLEKYRDQVQKELAGVEGRIQELKRK